ncbi:MAG: hypothetical protein ACUVQH_04240 [Thermogutta sp.]
MGFTKAFVVGVVFLAGGVLVGGCHAKKADEKPAPATSVDQTQIQDQPSPLDTTPATSPRTVPEEQPGAARPAEMTQSVPESGQAAESSAEAQSTDDSDEDRVSLGRMIGGLLRAARSAVPVPIPASGGSAPNSAEEAPRFPQP